MVDATISRVRMRDLARRDASAGLRPGSGFSQTPARAPGVRLATESGPKASSLASTLPSRPRAPSSRPETAISWHQPSGDAGGQRVVERRVLEAVRFGYGLVRDPAADDVDAARELRIRGIAPIAPRSASCSTYGSVTFVSARVDVIGTAPGMFATQ